MNFQIINKNYQKGLWSIQNVKTAVAKGVITKEQYNSITGCIYPAIKKEDNNETNGN